MRMPTIVWICWNGLLFVESSFVSHVIMACLAFFGCHSFISFLTNLMSFDNSINLTRRKVGYWLHNLDANITCESFLLHLLLWLSTLLQKLLTDLPHELISVRNEGLVALYSSIHLYGARGLILYMINRGSRASSAALCTQVTSSVSLSCIFVSLVFT